jgi:hypothetical protein
MDVQLTKVEARSYQHALGDKKNPTRYEVRLDGELIGTVESRSVESWRKSGRIRTGFIGFARHWRAELNISPIGRDRVATDTAYRRSDAVDRLVAAWYALIKEGAST